MKGKVKRIVVVLLAVFAVAQVLYGTVAMIRARQVKSSIARVFAGDLRWRRNEMRCAHQGVNSFHIWNREMTLPGFVPLYRPDIDKECVVPNNVVHAYPPWHTPLFYFYGWLPERMCIAVMSVVFGFCLCFIFYECLRLTKARFEESEWVTALTLILIVSFVVPCFIFLNYGVLILAALLFMNKMLEKGHVIWAGLAWALMMIKPQVGLLFVWPLFWHRKYWTIVTAAVVCLAATFVTSFIVHESVVDLILQVPKIGAPYSTRSGVEMIARPFLGEHAKFVVMIVFFILTGFATWIFRKSDDFMLSCVPVVLAIPLWAYSQEYDRVVMLVAFLFMVGHMFQAKKFDKWVWIGGFYLMNMVCIYVWRLASSMGLFDASSKDVLYNVMTFMSQVFLFLFLVFLMCEKLPRKFGLKKGE